MDTNRDHDRSTLDDAAPGRRKDLLAEAILGSRRSMFFFALTVFTVTVVPILSVPLMAVLDGMTEWGLPTSEPVAVALLVLGCALQAVAVTAGARWPRTGVSVVALLYLSLAVGLMVPSWLISMYLVMGLALFLLASRVALTEAICWTLGVVLGCMAVLAVGLLLFGTDAHLLAGYIAGETARFAAPAAGGAALGAWWAVRVRHLERIRADAERSAREQEGRIFAAQAVERERIAQELHDVAGQHLAGLVTLADAAVAIAPTQADRAIGLIEEVRDEGRFAAASLAGALTDLRAAGTAVVAVSRDLRTVSSLIDYWRQHGMDVEFTASGALDDLPPVVSTTAYRALQEGLTNAAKHAPGALVTAYVAATADAVIIDVRDSGRESHGDAVAGLDLGWGLAGMRERVALLGGQTHAAPIRGGGWALTVRMPLTTAVVG